MIMQVQGAYLLGLEERKRTSDSLTLSLKALMYKRNVFLIQWVGGDCATTELQFPS